MTMAQFSRDDMLIYQGREEGREEGRAEGKAEAIIDFLNDIGELPDSLEKLIIKQTDAQTLQKWLKLAARTGSIEEFEKINRPDKCRKIKSRMVSASFISIAAGLR